MFVPLESSSAVLVMISSMSVSICNRSHARWANSGKITISKGAGGTPSSMPSFEGNLLTQWHKITHPHFFPFHEKYWELPIIHQFLARQNSVISRNTGLNVFLAKLKKPSSKCDMFGAPYLRIGDRYVHVLHQWVGGETPQKLPIGAHFCAGTLRWWKFTGEKWTFWEVDFGCVLTPLAPFWISQKLPLSKRNRYRR